MLKFVFILAVAVAAVSAHKNRANHIPTSTVPPPHGVNGKLTPELHARIRQEITNKTYADFLRDMDTDGDHKISLSESVAYTNSHWDAEATLEDAKRYDLDHDGFISEAEIDAYKTAA